MGHVFHRQHAENVRAALFLVSRGEAPVGIVYKTDAVSDPAVRIVAMFPEDTHPPIIYPVALTSKSANSDAVAFLAYLHTPTSKRCSNRRASLSANEPSL